MIQIYPGITVTTSDDFARVLNKLSGLAPVLAVDISDGVFVPTKLLGVEQVRLASNQVFQVHLMAYHPEEIILPLLDMPNVESIVFHIEATDKAEKIIDTIHKAGKKAGITLNPETSIEAIEPFVGQVDFVQFMMVHPGAYGGEFQPQVLAKMASFHEKYPEVIIEIDGGANPERVSDMVKAGATMIESGGYIANSENPAQAISNLKKASE